MMMQGRPAGPGRGGPPMGGPMGGMMGAPGAKVQDFKGTMKKLIAYLGSYKIAIVIVFIFAIASTAANIFGPKLLGQALSLIHI